MRKKTNGRNNYDINRPIHQESCHDTYGLSNNNHHIFILCFGSINFYEKELYHGTVPCLIINES